MGDENRNENNIEDRISQAIAGLVSRHNNEPIKAIETLLTENFSYREKIRERDAKIAELNGQLPAEGAIILKKSEAEAWEAYKALGKPEELKVKIEERDTLAAEAAGLKRQAAIAQVAEAAGFNAKVLQTLAGESEFEVKTMEVDGKTVSKAFIFIPSADGKTREAKPLGEYAEANWSEFLPALQAAGGDSGRRGGDQGTPFIRQERERKAPTGDDDDLVGSILQQKEEARKATANPLMRPAPVPSGTSGAAETNR